MNLDKLASALQGQPRYRRRQVDQAIFVNLIETWDEATNLPRDLRALLHQGCPLEIKAEIREERDEKAAKALVLLDDGNATEAVLMRHREGRNTVCVSSQIGCPLGCEFCLTGRMGFKRNLSAMEIVSQVVLFGRWLKKKQQRVSNVVFMGMGEPFLNYEAVIRAVRMINSPEQLNIGARRISISTIGITEGIEKLSRENLQVNLAISLHASRDEVRRRLIPENDRYPIKRVLAATAQYIERTRRRVMIEYLILEDLNDSAREAERLAKLLKNFLGRLFFVNLITYNPTGKYRATTPEKVGGFKKVLESEGITVTQRYRFGREIKGACGQLAGEGDQLAIINS